MNSYERIVRMRDEAHRIKDGIQQVPPIIPTGIVSLDHKLNGGLPRQKLCVIAARTSHGKTATAIRLAVNMTLQGRRVHVFWMEDDELEFDQRAIAALAREPIPAVQAAYRRGELDQVINRIPKDKMNMWPLLTTHWLERPSVDTVCQEIEKCEPNSVVIIDHLGEIGYDIGPKHEAMGNGLREIRKSQRKAKCLVIALTQLNRDWDRRKSQSDDPDRVRPVLSDIENSGQIEQVARVCIIAEKRHVREGEEQVPTGQYYYHVWKPYVAVAECKWDDRTSTPDNNDPNPHRHYSDTEKDD